MSRATKPHVESQGTKAPQSTAPPALMWPYQGQEIEARWGKHTKNTQRPPQHTNPSKDSLTMAAAEEEVRAPQKGGASQEETQRYFPLLLCPIPPTFVFLSVISVSALYDHNCPIVGLVILKPLLCRVFFPPTSSRCCAEEAVTDGVEEEREQNKQGRREAGDEEPLACMLRGAMFKALTSQVLSWSIPCRT